MKLFFRCIYCGKSNDLPYNQTDRVSLRNECGQAISRHCNKCQKHCIISINEVKAKEGKLNFAILIAGFLLSIILSVWTFLKLYPSEFLVALEVTGCVLAIPSLFAIVYSNSAKNSVRLFNQHYI